MQQLPGMIRHCPSCHVPEGAPHKATCSLVTQSPPMPTDFPHRSDSPTYTHETALPASDSRSIAPQIWERAETILLREISAKLNRIIVLLELNQ